MVPNLSSKTCALLSAAPFLVGSVWALPIVVKNTAPPLGQAGTDERRAPVDATSAKNVLEGLEALPDLSAAVKTGVLASVAEKGTESKNAKIVLEGLEVPDPSGFPASVAEKGSESKIKAHLEPVEMEKMKGKGGCSEPETQGGLGIAPASIQGKNMMNDPHGQTNYVIPKPGPQVDEHFWKEECKSVCGSLSNCGGVSIRTKPPGCLFYTKEATAFTGGIYHIEKKWDCWKKSEAASMVEVDADAENKEEEKKDEEAVDEEKKEEVVEEEKKEE